MYMDAFGWSTQSPAAPCQPSCPGDDALLAAFLGTSFDIHSVVGGNGAAVSSDAYGGLDDLPSQQLSLLRFQDGLVLTGDTSAPTPAAFLDSVDVLPAMGGAHGGLLDRFSFSNVPERVQAAASNTAFSGYSSTATGGGNISSGESNTYGGHDTEVASTCAASPATLSPSSKRMLAEKYPVVGAPTKTTTTKEATAAERRSTKRTAAATTISSITFGRQPAGISGRYEPDTEAIAQVKEMIYRAAAMRPVSLGAAEPSAPQKPRRKNVRISSDPQTVAARLRREKVSERLRVLQRLVPGGSKMDTATMLDEAASYLRFLKSQLEALETLGNGGTGAAISSNYNGNLLKQHYCTGRNGASTASSSNSTLLTFGRDGLAGCVKSNRNMQF